MRRHLSKVFKVFLLAFIFIVVKQAVPVLVNALASGTPGSWYPGASAVADVSIAGTYAVTNLPQSWFEITTVNSGTVKVQVKYQCTSAGKIGFKVFDGSGTLLGDFSNACASGSGGTTPALSVNVPSGSIDPDGLYYAHVYI